jgi:hypothetical protein
MNLKLFIFVMGFGGGFSGSKSGGLKVVSGSHGQVLRLVLPQFLLVMI